MKLVLKMIIPALITCNSTSHAEQDESRFAAFCTGAKYGTVAGLTVSSLLLLQEGTGLTTFSTIPAIKDVTDKDSGLYTLKLITQGIERKNGFHDWSVGAGIVTLHVTLFTAILGSIIAAITYKPIQEHYDVE